VFSNHDEGATISLHVLPNAPKSQIIGEHNNSLKIKIKAPPVEGKANDAIIKFFSEILNIPKSRLEILRGDKSRGKILLVRGLTAETLARLLLNPSPL
jgi:uncharacterized protein (TIGR00251 family)